jgi:hypothetical protein
LLTLAVMLNHKQIHTSASLLPLVLTLGLADTSALGGANPSPLSPVCQDESGKTWMPLQSKINATESEMRVEPAETRAMIDEPLAICGRFACDRNKSAVCLRQLAAASELGPRGRP